MLPSSSAPATLFGVRAGPPDAPLRRVARKRHLRRIRCTFVWAPGRRLPAAEQGAAARARAVTWRERRALCAAGWRGRLSGSGALLSVHAFRSALLLGSSVRRAAVVPVLMTCLGLGACLLLHQEPVLVGPHSQDLHRPGFPGNPRWFLREFEL